VALGASRPVASAVSESAFLRRHAKNAEYHGQTTLRSVPFHGTPDKLRLANGQAI
jgi:1,6-anhydro-N-acetylmuramate kinase